MMLKYSTHCPVCNNTDSFTSERILNGYELVKCPYCRFVFADISDDDALKANSSFSEGSDTEYQENQTGIDQTWFRYFSAKISKNSPKKGKILDVGCGNGVLLSILKDFGWQVHGNDLSPWAIKHAKKIGYQLYNQPIECLDFKNEFDCIVSTSTFEHVTNPAEHLSKIIDALKPGGYGWITIPNYNSLSIRLNISRFDYNQPPCHINYFTPKSLKKLFEIMKNKHNFNYRIRIYGIPELFSFYIFLNKLKAKLFKQKSKKVDDSQSAIKHEVKVRPPSFFKLLLFKFIVLFNYYIGGILGIGDRIEFYIKKL